MENTYSKWLVTNDISEVDVSGVIFPYDLELISTMMLVEVLIIGIMKMEAKDGCL